MSPSEAAQLELIETQGRGYTHTFMQHMLISAANTQCFQAEAFSEMMWSDTHKLN